MPNHGVLLLASHLGQYAPIRHVLPLIESLEVLEEALRTLPVTLEASYISSIFKFFDNLPDSLCDYWSHSLQQTPRDHIVKCFYIDAQWVTIKCSNILVQNGTTGKAIWPAALAFIDGMQMFWPILKQADRIVEIGCGVGLVGRLLTRAFSNVLLTDTEQVLETTRLNVDPKFTFPLDWNDPSPLNSTDFIIATDVLYDPSSIPLLVMIVSTRKCIFVQEVRNPDTWASFLEALSNDNISYSVTKHERRSEYLLYCPESIVILFVNCTNK